MKVSEYRQMMEYLTRPGFNGGGSVRNKIVLPKKKPEEEVKKRKLENFEKAKPALENPEEVRKMMAMGGDLDTPKRGLVDEPGSYSKAKGTGIPLSADQIKLLKDNLSKREFNLLDFNRTGVKKDAVNYGVGLRDNLKSDEGTNLFKKVRGIVSPEFKARSTASKILDNEILVKRITKLLNTGRKIDDSQSKYVFEQLKNLKSVQDINFTQNNLTTAINELVRTGKLPEKYKTGTKGRTVAELQGRKDKVLKIVNDAIKNKKTMPSLSKIAEQTGIKTYNEVTNILTKEKGADFVKKYFPDNAAKQKARILSLANDGKVVSALSDGSILDEKMMNYISKKLGVSDQVAGTVLYDLRESYLGKKNYVNKNELPKISAQKGFDAINKKSLEDPLGDNPYYDKVRASRSLDVSKAIGEDVDVFGKKRRDTIKKIKPFMEDTGLKAKGVGLETDEIFNLSTAFKTGGQGYATFQQTLTKTGNKSVDSVNLQKAKKIDQRLLDIREKMINGTATPKDVKMYNQSVNKIVADINATIPKNLPKVRAITFVEGGDPNKTVGNIKQLKEANPTAYQTIIDDAEKTGYSAKIPKDVKTIYDQGDISKTIQKNIFKGFGVTNQQELLEKVRKTPKQKIKNLFNKIIRRVAEGPKDDRVRYASAPNIMTDAGFQKPKEEFNLFDYVKENPIKTGAAATGVVADAAFNKGKVLRMLSVLDTPFAAALTAITGNMGPEAATFFSSLAKFTTKELGLLTKSKSGFREILKNVARFPLGKKYLGQALYKNIPGLKVPLVGMGGAATLGSGILIPIAAANKQRKIFNRMKDNIAFAVNENYPNASPDAKKFAIDKTLSNLIELNNPAIRDYSESIALPESEMSEKQLVDRDVYNLSRDTDFGTGQTVEPSSGILNFFNRLAGGGIAKMAGVDSGPPPEKGPTPQGLDFLAKRGR